MNGEQLYALYEKEHGRRGCGIDPWETLDDAEREVWDAMAVELSRREPRPAVL